MIWGVIPAKDFDQAKQRLSPILRDEERCALFEAMFADVVSTLTKVRSLAGVMVVTRDDKATEIADNCGARILREAENLGQSAAISFAAETLAIEGVQGMLALPGDIPMVSVEDIEAVLSAHKDGPALTIVSDDGNRGSNCMTCSPPNLIPFSFGNDSFKPHVAAAKAAGVIPTIVKLPGIGLDIDRPDDLIAMLAQGGTGKAFDFLKKSGIPARLEAEGKLVKPA